MGKTFLLKKILQGSDEKTLTAFIDISKLYSTNKKVTEEEVLKEILSQIKSALQENQSLFGKFEENIKMFGKKLHFMIMNSQMQVVYLIFPFLKLKTTIKV